VKRDIGSQVLGPVGRAINKKRKRGVLERRLKGIIAAILFAALLLLLT
jgi:tetrahydromethanopterin S-methyltransferase subunit F